MGYGDVDNEQGRADSEHAHFYHGVIALKEKKLSYDQSVMKFTESGCLNIYEHAHYYNVSNYKVNFILNEWIYVILALLGFVFAIGILSWMLGAILQEIFELKWIKEFSKDFKDAVKHSQPSWDEIKEIASTRGLTQSKIQFTLRKFYREILTGRDSELLEHKTLIKNYIDKYREDEPFEGLPNEVRIHLEKVREQLSGNEHYLEPLTNQIKDLLMINEKDRKYQRYYTIGGFFVGLAGLALAAYTVLVQPNVTDVVQDKPVSQIELPQRANKATQSDS